MNKLFNTRLEKVKDNFKALTEQKNEKLFLKTEFIIGTKTGCYP
ncbi:hypothetical protein [uncultured Draconibacterium sp.]